MDEWTDAMGEQRKQRRKRRLIGKVGERAEWGEEKEQPANMCSAQGQGRPWLLLVGPDGRPAQRDNKNAMLL